MILPDIFLSNIKPLLKDDFDSFIEAMRDDVPVSVRLNDKISIPMSDDRVAWCDSAYYLSERPLFTADPLFHAGAYYVQEASSMFLCQVLEQFVSKDSIVLDLSAAPGGKSTLISNYLSDDGFLVANEIVRSRAYILAENLIKWGNPNVLVSNNSPKDFQELPAQFDAIVLDAPCSGEGMFRKDSGAIAEWSEQNVIICEARQQDIVRDVWCSLKTGGVLIYSTCTFNEFENESNVRWIADELGADVLKIDSSNFPEILNNGVGCRFFFHRTKGEGFFIAALRKTAETPSRKIKFKESKQNQKSLDHSISQLKNHLINPDKWSFLNLDKQIFANYRQFDNLVKILLSKLNTLHYGVKLADIKGNDLIPNISLALSKKLNRDAVMSVEVDKTTALSYLKRENIVLSSTERAYFLLLYESLPIGWVKNLGNRANNLYPQEWRIRMNL